MMMALRLVRGLWSNHSGRNYVAWNWAAAPGFLDIVTYAGSAPNPQDVPHQLTTKPGAIIYKSTTQPANWNVYHQSIPGKRLWLNGTDPTMDASVHFNEPTADTFSVLTAQDINGSGEEFVAYLFADTPGLIKCDFYTGDGTADGSKIIDCGFNTGWVMIKSADDVDDWHIFDVKRDTPDPAPNPPAYLQPNTTTPENSNTRIDFTSNGFSVISSRINTTGVRYIYVAIAEDASSVSETELTLTDATDLPYFEVGDKVEGLDTPATFALSPAFTTTTLYG